MNDILRNIRERRSIRKFKSDMPKKEDLEAIAEAGLFAPSGMNRQGTLILVITDKETRDRLSRDNGAVMGRDPNNDPFYGGPAILVVLSNKEYPTYLYDGSLVMENMLLAAHSLGLGSIWVHRAKEVFELDYWKDFLKKQGIEGDYEGIGNCVIGYPDGDIPPAKDRLDKRVYWVE